MDENNIIKKKQNTNYYRRHHNHNRYYYKNKKKKNLILDFNDTGEIRNIMSYNEEKKEPVVENILLVNEQSQSKTENDLVLNQEVNTLIENNIDYDEPVVPLRKAKNSKKLVFNKKYLKYGLSFAVLLIAVFSTSYSYFNYTKIDSRQADIASGEVYVKIVEDTTSININKMYPREDSEARSKNDNYFDFTIKGKNTSLTKAIIYSININNGVEISGKTRINPQYVKVDLQEKINNEYVYIQEGVSLNSFSYMGVIPVNTTSEITKEYRLRIWVGDNITISDTEIDATYTQAQFNNLYATYNISVDSRDAKLGIDMVRDSIAAKVNASTNSCNPIWTDSEDNIQYFSGDSSCVNMNYVWYSGKLWRITSIYPDGSMKLVTNNIISAIPYGEINVDFYTNENNSSYMYQWLNEDFYSTLYNFDNYVDTTKLWNATVNEDYGTKPANTTMVNTKVGLLNSYDYYNSYRCISSNTCTGTTANQGYLFLLYYWWLLDPGSIANYVGSVGRTALQSIAGVRPSIILKAGVEFTGSGTSSDPYKIVGDKKVGKANELINTRLSGEYVKLKNGDNEKLFRIIETNDNKTKLITIDYAVNSNKKFATNNTGRIWGQGTTTGSNTWYTYLNDTYYPNLVETYGNLFDSGMYYFGEVEYNYKLGVCANLTSGPTSTCTKTSLSGSFNVGIPRIGEMFAITIKGYSSTPNMWLINSRPSTYIWGMTGYGFEGSGQPSAQKMAKATVYLKQSVKILSGSGTESDPYIVGL